MEIQQFAELIGKFAKNNFKCDCTYCNENGTELTIDDYKGSYEIAIKKLFSECLILMKRWKQKKK